MAQHQCVKPKGRWLTTCEQPKYSLCIGNADIRFRIIDQILHNSTPLPRLLKKKRSRLWFVFYHFIIYL